MAKYKQKCRCQQTDANLIAGCTYDAGIKPLEIVDKFCFLDSTSRLVFIHLHPHTQPHLHPHAHPHHTHIHTTSTPTLTSTFTPTSNQLQQLITLRFTTTRWLGLLIQQYWPHAFPPVSSNKIYWAKYLCWNVRFGYTTGQTTWKITKVVILHENYYNLINFAVVRWHCLLDVYRKSIQPVKTEWWSVAVVVCLEGPADATAFRNPSISCLI